MTNENRPISEIIQKRLEDKGIKFFSNDSIGEFITEDEKSLLLEEVESKVKDMLKSLVIDINNDHNTQDTARRVAKMFINETFSGRYDKRPKVTAFPNASKYEGLYMTGPITVRSTCAHHFQNIVGQAWIGIFPGEEVIGLSKFNRIVDWVASRPQIQEEMSIQIADEIEKETKAKGVAVIIKAVHHCMTHRGVKEHDSDMTTSIMRGEFLTNVELKKEFLALLSNMKGISS